MNTPSAVNFASRAFAYLGCSYNEMDCRGLINAMLDDVGVDAHYKGSNALWRDVAWRGTPEEAVAAFGSVPVGALLFIVVHDGGEVARGYHDDLGNATHVGVKTGTGKGAIHSSASRGGVFESVFCDQSVPNGGWNRVGLLKQIDYGLNHDKLPPADMATATVWAENDKPVKMRAKPSSECALYWEIECGSLVFLRGKASKGWCPVRHGARDGWMKQEFLRIDALQLDGDVAQDGSFVVVIPHVDAATATYLLESYKGATATEEKG